MSDSLNSVTLSGNLGQDAEVLYTNNGLAITSFSLAVSKSRKQSDGSYKDVTSWVDCIMYGKRGEAMYGNGLLQKGARLAIIGHLHQSVWEKDGQRRSRNARPRRSPQPIPMCMTKTFHFKELMKCKGAR